MSKLIKQSTTVAAVIISISLAGCARFDERTQANDDFNYEKVQLVPAYHTGSFATKESREQFAIPVLSDQQVKNGFLLQDVDIRPPTQLMPVIDGVLLLNDPQHSKVLFNGTESGDNTQDKVWQLLNSYLAANKINLSQVDSTKFVIETTPFSSKEVFSGLFTDNVTTSEASYRLTLEPMNSGHSTVLQVELLSYSELNDNRPLKFTMVEQRNKSIELRFVNDLLTYAYQQKQVEENSNGNGHPLTIKLGFDDNHQNIWIAENTFTQTSKKISELVELMNFEVLEIDRNLGYLLVDYSVPNDDYWAENNLNPFKLKFGEYYIQLGEIDDTTTSISWLTADKKPIENQKVTDLYLSITDQVRGVLLKKDKQTKAL